MENIKEYYEKNIKKYKFAMDSTRLQIAYALDEISEDIGRNIYSDIDVRLKTLESTIEKCERKKIKVTELTDIAGIRIICLFEHDVYNIFNEIRKMPTLAVITRKDYIESPKENGYRSLHLILSVPVYSAVTKSEILPIEVQIRTAAMHLWATMEHSIKYKNKWLPEEKRNDVANNFKTAAQQLAEFDRDMTEFVPQQPL